MCRPTRLQLRGRLIRLGEMSEDDAQSLHRGTGGSTYTRKARATREAPERGQVRDDSINRTPARVLCVKFCKGGHGWLESCGLAELNFLVLFEIVHIEVAVGFEPVLVGLDG